MDQLDNPISRIDRIKHGRSETVTKIAEVDDLVVYATANDGLIIQAVRWGANQRAVESYQLTLCPEDAKRIREVRR
jgi:hypothetical protein